MTVETISLFDELEDIYKEETIAPSSDFEESDQETKLRYYQNQLWTVYKRMILFYQFPMSGIFISQKCIDWKDVELRKFGDFKKNREEYKAAFRQIDTYSEILEKLLELKAVMLTGDYLYVTETFEKKLRKLVSNP
ncbi:TPA: hypothetical protein TZW92_001846 [Streptococcus suis]|nr:hypothetical protein [Streptococcus suis]